MKILFNISLWLIFTSGFSQTRVLLSVGNKVDLQFSLYEEGKFIKPAERRLDNKSVESLMSNILGADNQDWVNSNELGGAKNAEQKSDTEFQQIRKRNKEKTYLQLISKLDIQSFGQRFAIVKFKVYLEQFPNGVTGAYQLQKVGDSWYKTSRSDLSEMTLMMIFFNPKILQELIEKPTSNVPIINELMTKTKEGKYLNFKKLYTEFKKWETDKKQKEYYLEPTGW
jgi:hypothetical protein